MLFLVQNIYFLAETNTFSLKMKVQEKDEKSFPTLIKTEENKYSPRT